MRNSLSTAVVVIALLTATTANSQITDELIARAVLPLPENMRADASVFTYDEDGSRQVLRQGSNAVECKIKDENAHTWCYPKSSAANRDYQAKLQAEGLEEEELQAAMAAALASGEVTPTIPGSLFYRLDENEGRMKLLWALILPNLSAAEIAASSGREIYQFG